MQIGDKIKMMSYRGDDDTIYTIVEIGEENDGWIKVKHPKVSGHFVFKKDRVDEIVSEIIKK